MKSSKKMKTLFKVTIGIIAAVLLLPLPVPQIKTLTGECLKHGEITEVKLRCLEMDFLMFEDRIFGRAYIQVGENAEAERYNGTPNHLLSRLPHISCDTFHISAHRVRSDLTHGTYFIYTDSDMKKMLLTEHRFCVTIPSEDAVTEETLNDLEHILVVSADGDMDSAIAHFPSTLLD